MVLSDVNTHFIDAAFVLRFTSYVGEAVDKDEPTDAEIPEWRKAGSTKNTKDEE